MKHLYIIIAAFILYATPVAAESLPETVIEDRVEADLLLGKHLFADNALGDIMNYGRPWAFSTASISEHNGVYSLEANMECYTAQNRNEYQPRGGYSRIHGHIINISSHEFSMKGDLEFRYLPGTPWEDSKKRSCKAQGVFRFTRVHSEPQDIDKDFWYLIRPENSINSSELQKPGFDCLRYVYPLLIFTDKIYKDPEQKFCSSRLEDFRTNQ